MLFSVVVLSCFIAIAFAGSVRDRLFFVETFDSDPFAARRWVKSTDPKYVEDTENPAAKVGPATHAAKGFVNDNGLRLTKEKKHYGLATKFSKPLTFGAEQGHKELVVQYEFKLEETLNCGGAYIKLLRDSPELDVTAVNGLTPYTIMFGPDKCGTVNKVHFILQHQNPLTHAWEEKHTNETAAMKGDKKTHLYTLNIKDDNSYEVYIDKKLSKSGNLLTHMVPPVNPPKEIDDPTDSKPADWVDADKIDDETAVKPDDWDENAPKEIENEKAVKPAGWQDDGPEKIPDPKASKPVDWDDEEDGEWEAPLIPNPACEKFGCGEWKRPKIKNPNYKGKWIRPKIPNPAYKGPWKARQIPNPAHYEDPNPATGLAPMGGLALEIWTINAGLHFDNFAIAHSLADAFAFADETFDLKVAAEGTKDKKDAKKKRDDAREAKKKTGTAKEKAIATVTGIIETAFEWAEENTVAAGVTAAAAVAILLVMFWPSRSRKSNNPRPAAPAVESTVAESTATDSSSGTADASVAATADSVTAKERNTEASKE